MLRRLSFLTLVLSLPVPCLADAPSRLRQQGTPRDDRTWAMGGHLTWWDTKDAGDGFGAGPHMRRTLSRKFALEGAITLFPETEEETGGATLTAEILTVDATALWLIPVQDTEMHGEWQPYLGAGFGYYKIDMDVDGIPGGSISVDNEIGLHAVLGMDIWASDRLDIPLQIRYSMVDLDATLRTPAGSVSDSGKLDGVSLIVGLNYRF